LIRWIPAIAGMTKYTADVIPAMAGIQKLRPNRYRFEPESLILIRGAKNGS